MNDLNLQTHEIAIYTNRKRLVVIASIIVLALLCFVGMDVFVLWAFWNHYEIDTGAYVAAFSLLIGNIFMGWVFLATLYRLYQRGPAISINVQGLTVNLPLRFTFLLRIRPSFIPWEEIECISTFSNGMQTWLTLRLKDPARYCSLYGYGNYRTWHRDPLSGAHINIIQYTLSLSARQILQRIEENYNSELVTYEVNVKH